MNETLKAKWLWRFDKEDTMWKKGIAMKYGIHNFGWWRKISYAHEASCWKSIISGLDHSISSSNSK